MASVFRIRSILICILVFSQSDFVVGKTIEEEKIESVRFFSIGYKTTTTIESLSLKEKKMKKQLVHFLESEREGILLELSPVLKKDFDILSASFSKLFNELTASSEHDCELPWFIEVNKNQENKRKWFCYGDRPFQKKQLETLWNANLSFLKRKNEK